MDVKRTQVGWWEPAYTLTGEFVLMDGSRSTTITRGKKLIPMSTTRPVLDTWLPVYVDGVISV